MKKILALAILLSFAMMTSTSCKKYEEGPLISLKTKSARLTRAWKLDKAEQNGVDITNALPALEQTFNDDGSYSVSNNGTEFKGSWEFDGDKENILIKMTGSTDTDTYKIIRLKSKELWLDHDVNGTITRYYWAEK
jgi:hypothetical protein